MSVYSVTPWLSNFEAYRGQNQASAGRGSRNTWQKPLSSYCTDDTEDILVISFLFQFGAQQPAIDLSDTSDECVGNFPGTQLLDCPHMEPDIQECQSRDKIILLSLGGATGAYGLSSAAQGRTLADTLWNTFGGGHSDMRPFGDAKVDGFDLDIEAGPIAGYPAFVERMREHYASDTSKKYYISGAPQCPFPDEYLSETLNSAWFDFVWVQFYNNYCSITSNQFNYDTWDEWARTQSVNKNVRLFLGVPASDYAAGQGYVPYNDLTAAIRETASRYTTFGGIMMWDASAAYANTEVSPNFAQAVSQFLHRLPVAGTTLNRIPSGNISAMAPAPSAEPTSSATPVSLYPPQPR
ncbi:chitinase [Fennellomyces sp. T-0311]|nr:chitinase [Fennellomyces sp. T-0311]